MPRLITNLFRYQGRLHSPDALLTPLADGHIFDQNHLRVGLGAIFGDEAGEHGAETLLVLTFQNNRTTEKAVACSVAGGDTFAFRGDRSLRFLSVGAGCGDSLFRTHDGLIMYSIQKAGNREAAADDMWTFRLQRVAEQINRRLSCE